MSVLKQNSSTIVKSVGGLNEEFTITFRINNPEHIFVFAQGDILSDTKWEYVTAGANGLPAIRLLGSYTLGIGRTIEIRRITPKTQELSAPLSGDFTATQVEGSLDKLTEIVQEVVSGAGDVEDVVVETAESIRNKLSTLESTERLDASAIKNIVIPAQTNIPSQNNSGDWFLRKLENANPTWTSLEIQALLQEEYPNFRTNVITKTLNSSTPSFSTPTIPFKMLQQSIRYDANWDLNLHLDLVPNSTTNVSTFKIDYIFSDYPNRSNSEPETITHSVNLATPFRNNRGDNAYHSAFKIKEELQDQYPDIILYSKIKIVITWLSGADLIFKKGLSNGKSGTHLDMSLVPAITDVGLYQMNYLGSATSLNKLTDRGMYWYPWSTQDAHLAPTGITSDFIVMVNNYRGVLNSYGGGVTQNILAMKDGLFFERNLIHSASDPSIPSETELADVSWVKLHDNTSAGTKTALETLIGSARLSATAIKDLPSGAAETGTTIVTKLTALTGSAKLGIAAIKGVTYETGATLKTKLETLTGTARLAASAIKDIFNYSAATASPSKPLKILVEELTPVSDAVTGGTRVLSLEFNFSSGNKDAFGIIYYDGHFYVSDRSDHKAYAYTTAGVYVPSKDFSYASGHTDAHGIIYYDGHFYMPDQTANKTFVYTAAGVYVPSKDFNFASHNSDAFGITYYDGHFYVPDYTDNKAYAYTTAGVYVPSKDFNFASGNSEGTGITYYDGHFYVSDYGGDKAYGYTTAGVYVASKDFSYASGNTYPLGITYYDGHFYVPDYTDDKAFVYTAAVVANATAYYSDKILDKDTMKLWLDVGTSLWKAYRFYIGGTVVIQSNKLYRCITSNSDASFTASKWTEISAQRAAETAASIKTKLETLTSTNRLDATAIKNLTDFTPDYSVPEADSGETLDILVRESAVGVKRKISDDTVLANTNSIVGLAFKNNLFYTMDGSQIKTYNIITGTHTGTASNISYARESGSLNIIGNLLYRYQNAIGSDRFRAFDISSPPNFPEVGSKSIPVGDGSRRGSFIVGSTIYLAFTSLTGEIQAWNLTSGLKDTSKSLTLGVSINLMATNGTTFWISRQVSYGSKLWAFNVITGDAEPENNINYTLTGNDGIFGLDYDIETATMYILWRNGTTNNVTAYVVNPIGLKKITKPTTKAWLGIEDFSVPEADSSDHLEVISQETVQAGEHLSRSDYSTLDAAANDNPVGCHLQGNVMKVVDDGSTNKVFGYNDTTKARDNTKDYILASANVAPRDIAGNATNDWVCDITAVKAFGYTVTGTQAPTLDFNNLGNLGCASPSGMAIDEKNDLVWFTNYAGGGAFAAKFKTRGSNGSAIAVPSENIPKATMVAAGCSSPTGIDILDDIFLVSDYNDKKFYAFDRITTLYLPHRDINGLEAAGNASPVGVTDDGNKVYTCNYIGKKLNAFQGLDVLTKTKVNRDIAQVWLGLSTSETAVIPRIYDVFMGHTQIPFRYGASAINAPTTNEGLIYHYDNTAVAKDSTTGATYIATKVPAWQRGSSSSSDLSTFASSISGLTAGSVTRCHTTTLGKPAGVITEGYAARSADGNTLIYIDGYGKRGFYTAEYVSTPGSIHWIKGDVNNAHVVGFEEEIPLGDVAIVRGKKYSELFQHTANSLTVYYYSFSSHNSGSPYRKRVVSSTSRYGSWVKTINKPTEVDTYSESMEIVTSTANGFKTIRTDVFEKQILPFHVSDGEQVTGYTYETNANALVAGKVAMVGSGVSRLLLVSPKTGETLFVASIMKVGFRIKFEKDSTNYVEGIIESLNYPAGVVYAAFTVHHTVGTVAHGSTVKIISRGSILHTNDIFFANSGEGDLLYYDNGRYNKLAKGANGQTLKMVNGLPAWVTV